MTEPVSGDGLRRYAHHRRVRLGDAGLDGCLRLDALARYLQDVAVDDADDAALGDGVHWVVRRLVVEVQRLPRYGERVEVATWCGGLGSRWAERCSAVTGASSQVLARALWVSLDDRTGMPARLPQRFVDVYGPTAAGRTVSSRLTHGAPPPSAVGRPWALRASDLDVLGHVNNAAYWEVLEEVLAGMGRPSVETAEVEHRVPIAAGTAVSVMVAEELAALQLWVTGGDGVVHASARISLR